MPFLSILEEYLEEGASLAIIPPEFLVLHSVVEKCRAFKLKIQGCLDGPDKMDVTKIRDFLRCAEGFPVVIDPELHRLRLRLNALKDTTLYCICQTRHDGETPMIGCDGCDSWFHFKCIGMDPEVGEKLEHYMCSGCQSKSPAKPEVEAKEVSSTTEKKARKKKEVILSFCVVGSGYLIKSSDRRNPTHLKRSQENKRNLKRLRLMKV